MQHAVRKFEQRFGKYTPPPSLTTEKRLATAEVWSDNKVVFGSLGAILTVALLLGLLFYLTSSV